ncbi:transcription-silencing protein Clr2-domain-containing protein [Aspergillus californicus]
MDEDSGDENIVIVPVNHSVSDGDPANWPTEARFGRPDDRFYRQKLATQWLIETGAYEPGVEYILDELPKGYALWDRPRGTNPNIRDRFLFGHPIGQYFSSTIQFFPHFYYLMTGGAGKCPCVLCEKLRKRQEGLTPYAAPSPPTLPTPPVTSTPSALPSLRSLPSQPSLHGSPASQNSFPATHIQGRRGRPPGSKNIIRPYGELPIRRPPGRPSGRPRGRPPGRPPGRPARPPGRPGFRIVDSEGTLDVFKIAVTKLKLLGSLEQDISEKSSMDWRAERSVMDEYLETIDVRPSYLPRLGELVLWAPDFSGELAWNPSTQRVEIYSPTKDRWLKHPKWRTGVIGQIPTEATELEDLVETTAKKWGLNYSGFRVETLPDPNSSDKSYSLHYDYVPLKCIKPLNAFEHFLQGIPHEDFHPSIENAMTVMSSFSLVDKYHFKGTWPNASIYCRGIFIGAEFLAIGDAIRLKPKGYQAGDAQRPPVTDVMVIKEIRLELKKCDEDAKSKQLAEAYQVRIAGKLYTCDLERAQVSNNGRPARALSLHEVVDAFNIVGMGGYGDWHELHSGSVVDISQDMVIGRCHEPDAMKLLFNSLSLDYDLQGVINAREYSRRMDERIPEGKHWFWGDFRTQTLAIESLNGEDVGHYSETRDVKMWRANLRIIDGNYSQADLRHAKQPSDLGRPSTKPRISSLAEVSKTSKLVSTGLWNEDTSNPVSSTDDEESGQDMDDREEDEGNGADELNSAEELSNAEQGEGEGGEVMDEDGSETSDQEEDYTTRMDELRGGTEETEGGDYQPNTESSFKRPRYELEKFFDTSQ